MENYIFLRKYFIWFPLTFRYESIKKVFWLNPHLNKPLSLNKPGVAISCYASNYKWFQKQPFYLEPNALFPDN